MGVKKQGCKFLLITNTQQYPFIFGDIFVKFELFVKFDIQSRGEF